MDKDDDTRPPRASIECASAAFCHCDFTQLLGDLADAISLIFSRLISFGKESQKGVWRRSHSAGLYLSKTFFYPPESQHQHPVGTHSGCHTRRRLAARTFTRPPRTATLHSHINRSLHSIVHHLPKSRHPIFSCTRPTLANRRLLGRWPTAALVASEPILLRISHQRSHDNHLGMDSFPIFHIDHGQNQRREPNVPSEKVQSAIADTLGRRLCTTTFQFPSESSSVTDTRSRGLRYTILNIAYVYDNQALSQEPEIDLTVNHILEKITSLKPARWTNFECASFFCLLCRVRQDLCR